MLAVFNTAQRYHSKLFAVYWKAVKKIEKKRKKGFEAAAAVPVSEMEAIKAEIAKKKNKKRIIRR